MTELFRHISLADIPAGDIGVEVEIGYLFGQYKRLRKTSLLVYLLVLAGEDRLFVQRLQVMVLFISPPCSPQRR